ncbi:protein kinase [Myxococcus sp. CA033]|uniref:serine/threonine protein kinase n=1 Tax=Myxococcus sp. CA033 TaxID=2741516 RepID=UPI00157A619B|nr:serine/threonine-protein kinase [Myxococcus sp. CA033]NTX38408.1 protein kinase [Myxococcus sp. CA033]
MIESNAPTNGAPPELVDPLLGRVLNERFRILETLGAGGMGRVYKAMQAPLDRLVALKVLNPHYNDEGKDPGFQKRFFLEASVTAKLRHPNTVTVIDYGKTDDGIYYIAMEYLDGLTLSQLLTQMGPIPWARALNITQQIARSLREAHKVGLIHRDLKPANVMVLNQETDHDIVKVLDFGLVKSFIGESEAQQDTSLTQAGIILGSPQYMAPEQARNIADPRSDVYSMGVVLYQMLMGQPPFLAAQSIDVIVKHINEPPPPFGAIWPGHAVPAEVEALVMKCLAKLPVERYQSMDEVLEAMRRVAHAVGVSGVFSGPRLTGVGSGPRSGPISAPGAGSGPSTMALDIAVEEPPAKPGKSMVPLAIFGGSLLLGGAVALAFALRPSTPMPKPLASPPITATAPANPTQPPAVPTRPAAAANSPATAALGAADDELALAPLVPGNGPTVRFEITSEPSGARVRYRGKDHGETPLNLKVPLDDDGSASAVLTFTMDGYQPVTITATGSGTKQLVTQKLKKKSSPPRPPRASDSNDKFKDNPY